MSTPDADLTTSDPEATARPVAGEQGPVVSRRALTIGLCLVVVAIAFESIAVATAMPVAARALNGLDWYAWSFSLFVIGMLFATVVGGRLADRIGPAKPMLIGIGIFAVGLVVAGSAEVMAQLMAGRLVQGLGSGLMNVAVYVCIARVFTPSQRPRMFTFISTAWVLPAFVGPPISAWLTSHLSWHWVFFAVLPLIALGTLMVLPTLRTMMLTHETPEPSETRPASLWAAGVVALAAAMIQLAGQRLDLIAIGLAVVGVLGLVLGLPRLMPDGFLRLRRGLSAVILVRALLPGAFFGTEAFIPLMLVEQRDLRLVLAGAVLTFGAVGWTTGSYLQSRTWIRILRDRLVTYGCLSVTLGIAIVATAAALPQLWIGLVAVGWVFSGFGMGLATSSTSLVVMTLSAETEVGRNASSLNLGDALGSGIFVGISGSIFAALHPSGNLPVTFATVMIVMAGVAVLSFAASLRVGKVV